MQFLNAPELDHLATWSAPLNLTCTISEHLTQITGCVIFCRKRKSADQRHARGASLHDVCWLELSW